MKIFINDIPVFIISSDQLEKGQSFDKSIDAKREKLSAKSLTDDVLVLNATPSEVDKLLHLMTERKFKGLDSVTFASEHKKEIVNHIKAKFKVIEAAGGVVEKGNLNLLIYRQGRWDLPKGKLDKGERKRDCAIREVEEETGVRAELKYTKDYIQDIGNVIQKLFSLEFHYPKLNGNKQSWLKQTG